MPFGGGMSVLVTIKLGKCLHPNLEYAIAVENDL